MDAMNRAMELAKQHGWTIQTRVADHNTTGILFSRGNETMTSEWVTSTGQLDWADYVAPRDDVFTPHYDMVTYLLSSIPATDEW